MQKSFQSLCVFCGSRSGARPLYIEQARVLGGAMAARKIELIYGGGSIGLMGTIAEAVLADGGVVKGVIPEALNKKEIAHMGLQELHVVKNMHERKAMMAELTEGFIAMPGGFGTLEELFEVMTWSQLRFHTKPIGILNVDHYYDPFLQMIDHTIEEGFVSAEDRELLVVRDEPIALLDAMTEKLVSQDETASTRYDLV